MTAIKKIWVFIKSYWYVPLLVIVGLIVGHKNTKLEKIMDAADDSRKKQNDAIDAARIEKKEKKIKIEKEYNSAVKAASKFYELQKKNLDKNKKNKIRLDTRSKALHKRYRSSILRRWRTIDNGRTLGLC